MQKLFFQFKAAFVLLYVCVSGILGNAAIAQTNVTSNISVYERLAVQLTNFDTSKSIDSLRYVIDEIKNNQVHLSRRQEATLWFLASFVIHRNLDLNYGSVEYDKTNSFSINLTPPDPKYMSGVDPSAIKEPDVRTEYEAMLKTNKEHAENYTFQLYLHRINNQVSSDIEKFLRSNYTASESDKTELNQILDQSKLSDSRKQQIRAIISQ